MGKKGQIPWNKDKKGQYHFLNKTQFKKGHIPWNKGIPMDPKVQAILIASLKGKKQTEEHKRKKLKAIEEFYKSPKGQILKEQQRQRRINDVRSGRVKTTKGINPWKHFKNPEETKRKIREKRKIQSPPTLGRHWTESQMKKYKISRSKWDIPPVVKNTSIEIKIQNKLNDLGVKYETHQKVICCFPDIIFEKEKIAVFCDGDYWHNLPNYKKRDANQNKILRENDWKVLRFWEHDINKNLEKCINIIEGELNG